MTPIVRLAAAVAAVAVVVAVAGIGPGRPAPPDVGQPVPTPTTTSIPPSPTAASITTPAASVAPEATPPIGTYRTWFSNVASVPGLTVDFTAPGGWQRFEDWAMFGPTDNGADPIAVGVFGAASIFSDPCHWDIPGNGKPGPGDITVGPTVDDLVAALRANSAYETSKPEDVAVGGYPGKALDLVPPPVVDPRMCYTPQRGIGSYQPFASDEDVGVLSHGIAARWHLRILDVAGTRVIITVIDYPGTTPGDRDAAQAMVDSMRFSP